MRGAYERTLEFLGQSRLVGPASIVIAEHEKKYELGETFGALTRYRRIVQGDAALSLYRRGFPVSAQRKGANLGHPAPDIRNNRNY